MKGMVSGLDDSARKNLAAFFANQQPAAPNVRKPLTAAEWAQRCDRCHGVNGNSVDPHIPALASQRPEYLVKALKEYRTRTRRNNEMAAMSDALSASDIDNLAAHYSRQKARPALYIVVPAPEPSK
jgi:cytochrome c553